MQKNFQTVKIFALKSRAFCSGEVRGEIQCAANTQAHTKVTLPELSGPVVRLPVRTGCDKVASRARGLLWQRMAYVFRRIYS
jgi:hypothetical protein